VPPHEKPLDTLLQGWLALADCCQKRVFVTDYPELLAEETEQVLDALIAQASARPDRQQDLCLCRSVLQDARRRGGSVAAICAACINMFGGFALEVPEWLVTLSRQSELLLQQGRGEQITAARAALWEKAEVRAVEEGLAAEIVTEIELRLGDAERARTGTGRMQHLENCIAKVRRCQAVYSRESYPFQWARVQDQLGKAYKERILGEPAENLELAIAFFAAALEVRTPDAGPYHWADTQKNLGLTYHERIRGNYAENQEQAIAFFEAALQVFTREAYPYEWAETQHHLGNAYPDRVQGERAENQERGIAFFEAALQVHTRKAYPYEWGSAQNHLGVAYYDRIRGERAENLERTIVAYEAALEVFTRNDFPVEWGRLQNNLANAYLQRIRGEQAENLERAISAHEVALQVRTRDTFPTNWATTQNNLGAAYFHRIRGDRGENIERAIEAYEAALQVRTRGSSPYMWATTQNNLGEAYRQRLRGERAENLEQAIAAFETALQGFPRDAFPRRWAETLYNLGEAYSVRIRGDPMDNLEHAISTLEEALQVRTREAFPAYCRSTSLLVAEQLAQLGRWAEAEERFATAVAIESDLFTVGAGEEGREAILRQGGIAADSQAFALTRLGRYPEAAVAVEAGRARSLAEARRFDRADPRRIGDAGRRRHYEEVLAELRRAQARLQQPGGSEQREAYLAAVAAYRSVRARFDALIAEIQVAHDPADFIQETITVADLQRTAAEKATGHAIVYLLVTPWGGAALGVFSNNPGLGSCGRIVALDLPDLSTTLVGDLLEQSLPDDPQRFLGGYGLAQEGSQLERICVWPGTTLVDRLATLETAAGAAGKESSLARAARAALATPALRPFGEVAVEDLGSSYRLRLAGQIDHFFLQFELERSLEVLGRVLIRPLAAWLREEGASSVTLIPSGVLTSFPLLAAPIGDDKTSWQALGTTLPASMAPSALSLIPGTRPVARRSGVRAVGNPLPTPQHLEWGEAEALTLAYLGGDRERSAVRTGYEAVRAWFIEAAEQARVLDVPCHGLVSGDDFLQYQILLANGETFTLADALNHVVDLRGLRLLILSACQTSLVHRNAAPGEMRSLAVGMLQAGADAVLAALWPVDDRATYLLMVRFAQEWFPAMDREPPAAALGRAERWMSTVSWGELRDWIARDLLPALHVDPRLTEQVRQVTEEPALVLPRGQRLGIGRAETLVREWAAQQRSEERPFANPYYWAAFHIVGW
jgi:CHAT domain-containing protein/tetratricopeptide (TPR) repeat protein